LKAKEYLQQLQKLDKLIENKLAEKERWKCIATTTTAPLSGERVQSSGNPQKMADAVCRYIELESEINTCIDSFVDQRQEIISTIEMLEVAEYDLLHKIYVQYLTLQDAATAFDKSYTWVTTMHGTALKHIQRILDERECEKV
jgi:hypothetical protein